MSRWATRFASAFAVFTVTACSILGSSVDGFSSGECPPGTSACGGRCVDFATSRVDCGSCGFACQAGETCVSGKCSVACPGGQVTCGGLCYELSNDPRNCGACQTACAAGEVCGNGLCSANCPMGATNCGGSCADLQTDSNHCGACGKTCAATEECVEGSCLIACRTRLNQGITDPWGFTWDGLERAATNWSVAQSTCEEFRGRLPTASEAYRVSATQSATVGQTIHGNQLWSLVPYGGTAHVWTRLSDAATGQVADTSNLNYRCVCPPPHPDVYTGKNCFGPPTSPCIAVAGDGNRRNLDAQDRAPLHKGGAIWECGFNRGRLPTPRTLAETIQQGIPAGSGAWLHTADEVRYDLDAVVRWTTGTGFEYRYTNGPNSASWASTTAFYPFRCTGENINPGPNPATVVDAWVSPQTRRTSQANDLGPMTHLAATDECWTRGGHLPTATELGELIVQGLPNGSGTWMWTGDNVGHNGSNFLASIKRWNGTDTRHLYDYTPDLDWAYKTDANKNVRCLFYPVDAMFAGPPAVSCAGGCSTITLPGTSGAKMWIDAFDRAPSTTVTAALGACRAIGGHLPSQRDLFEAIRKGGLPNGTGAELWSSDLMIGNQSYLLAGVVKWTGVDTAFTDLYTAYSTWANPTTSHPYRCMWTNELR